MTTTMKSLAIAALLSAGALPALAQSDAGMMTCGDYMGMDAAGRATAANQVQAYAMKPANASTATVADEQLHGLSTVEVQRMIDAHCSAQDAAGKTIIQRLGETQ